MHLQKYSMQSHTLQNALMFPFNSDFLFLLRFIALIFFTSYNTVSITFDSLKLLVIEIIYMKKG